jgi:heparosan-N-sulfate-glucuronate 5-epimerase
MRDTLMKLVPYFESCPTYWKVSQAKSIPGRLGPYPLSFRDRLFQGHYRYFDQKGLPLFHSRRGELMHFVTGMCSFGLANWEEYLLTQDEQYASKVIAVADYIMNICCATRYGGLMLYDYDNDNRENPVACAMNQGEGISVLLRAHSFTGNDEYLQIARQLALPFEHPYGLEGVTGNLMTDGVPWYLEGGKRVLNGHVYALFGLKELSDVSSEKRFLTMFSVGIQSLQKGLHFFDTGFWSLYWLEEPSYVASAMYHNLHICQLDILSSMGNDDELLKWYSERFRGYMTKSTNRLRAGLELVRGKVRLLALR